MSKGLEVSYNQLIKLGLACHYKKNENDQYVEGREIYARSELDSRMNCGLTWIPPWEWRKN